MSIQDGYKPEDYNVSFEEGDYRIKIIEATEKRSQSGNEMIELKMLASGSKMEFRYYLVKNEHFNANATRLFDCFGIRRGDFNIRGWVNKIGVGHIAKGKPKQDGKSYFEIRYLIVADKPEPKPVVQEAKQFQQAYENKEASPAGFEDEYPTF